MTYERQNIRELAGYTPGEQPADPRTLKLNTNENPYPPSSAVRDALAGFDPRALRRYPPPLADPLRKAAARLHGVPPEWIIATNGGDELLRLAVTTFLPPGAPLGITDPSYSLYPVLAAIQRSPVERIPLAADWSLPDDFVERLNRSGARLACVVNPHAPSGHLVPAERLASVARAFEGVLLIDEAYVDFVDPEAGYDSLALAVEYDNVLLLRSLSKGYSLAGLRLGYGVGRPELLAPMVTKTRDSYNVDLLSQTLGAAALDDASYARRMCAHVRAERARLRRALAALGLDAPPSHANFLLARVPPAAPLSAEALYRALKARGILVRHFDADGLRDRLRITIGTPEENDRLLQAFSELLTR